jgi:hypothetical protein
MRMPWNVWSLTESRWLLMQSVKSRSAAQDAIDVFLKRDNPGHKLEPRIVRSALETNGTGGVPFKPDAVWRMALRDLDARVGNATAVVGKMRHYHFHRDHVRKAATANDILRAAIADLEKGRQSSKKLTRLLYTDAELLKAALQ